MNNFGVLYRYECKKLWNRKIVWLSLLLCIITIVLSVFIPLWGNYYIDGKWIDTNYHMYQTDRQYAEALNGREINQTLLEETIAAYRKIPETPGQNYTATEEYQRYARPYSQIFQLIRQISGMSTSKIMLSWQPSEDDLYAKRRIYLRTLWEDQKLSEGEMDYWTQREAQINTPYVYQEHTGYDFLFSISQTMGLFVLMLVAICLSGVFSEEHTRKTDQIVLCSPLGKTMLYWAKMAAGISFCVSMAILIFTAAFVPAIGFYGAGGFQAAFQLMYAPSSDPITCGQAVLIVCGNIMAAAVVMSVFVMFLSESLHSNIAALAISTGLLIVAQIFHVPEQYRVLAQIWDWSFWGFLAPWNIFGNYTLPVFGHYFAPWQAVPMLCLIGSAMIAVIGKPIWQRFQITGR